MTPSTIPCNTTRVISFSNDRGHIGVQLSVRTCRRNAAKVNIGRTYGIPVGIARQWVRDVAAKAAIRGYTTMSAVDRPLGIAEMNAASEYEAWRADVDAKDAANEQLADQWAEQWERIHDEIQAA